MRDGSVRRLAPKPAPRTWTPERVQVQHWRTRHRRQTVRALAANICDLGWNVGLLTTLLDELHVTDEFDELAGPLDHVPISQYPRLIALALLLRHSWSAYDLTATAHAIGVAKAVDTAECACFRRRRGASHARANAKRERS